MVFSLLLLFGLQPPAPPPPIVTPAPVVSSCVPHSGAPTPSPMWTPNGARCATDTLPEVIADSAIVQDEPTLEATITEAPLVRTPRIIRRNWLDQLYQARGK